MFVMKNNSKTREVYKDGFQNNIATKQVAAGTPPFSYFDLYLYTGYYVYAGYYAGYYVYFTVVISLCMCWHCKYVSRHFSKT